MKNQPILILGIGIFFWALGATFAFLLQYIVRNLLFLIGEIPPLVNLLFNEIIYLSVFIGLFYGLIYLLKTGKYKLLSVFYWSIGLVIFVQILQFILPLMVSNIYDETYWGNASEYSDFYGLNMIAPIISGIFNLAQYGVLAWLIYQNRNLLLKSELNSSEINEIGKPPANN